MCASNTGFRKTIQRMKVRWGGQPALTGIRDNWTRELVNLDNYNGYAGDPTVRFRFRFTSDNDAKCNFAFEKDDGFYIDDIKLVKTTSILLHWQ